MWVSAPPAVEWPTIDSVEELVGLLGEPNQRARDKGRDRLLDVDRAWLAASPYCVMATADEHGRCDASPKGDPSGQLVHVVDDVTIPDLLGQRGAPSAPIVAHGVILTRRVAGTRRVSLHDGVTKLQ